MIKNKLKDKPISHCYMLRKYSKKNQYVLQPKPDKNQLFKTSKSNWLLRRNFYKGEFIPLLI